MKKQLFISLLILFLLGCSNKKNQIVSSIDALEETMADEDFPSKENMKKIIILYNDYANNYPNDEKTYGYLELKAKYQNASEEYTEAVKTYRTIINKYPNNPRTAENMFMLAFIQDNNLGNKKRAEELYKKIINDYPSHELADDAQFSLDNLYLSDSEILKMLEEKINKE